ncbi:MAG TPA: alpha/beta hydrolase [Gammaproteobacteria bacterium]|nr:alpha/beta hydrolase [Gammaproteobacteria bacterium]
MTDCNGQPVLIDGPAGKLELLCEGNETAERVMIICHPHTLHGGTMQNKVVHTLARAVAGAGAIAVRFNFRGAGNSEGSYDEGCGELADLIAVRHWVKQQWPVMQMGVAGFSFGSYVAWQAVAELDAICLITVAPPVSMYPFERLPTPRIPWLLVQGEQDEVISATEVLDWARLHPGVEISSLADCSHFFHRRLRELSDVVEQWCKRVFQD